MELPNPAHRHPRRRSAGFNAELHINALQGGFIAMEAMGDPNASIPTPHPVHCGLMAHF